MFRCKQRKLRKGDLVEHIRYHSKNLFPVYYGNVLSVNRGTIEVENIGAAAEKYGKISYDLEITLRRTTITELNRLVKLHDLLVLLK